jgi:tetratricopeptide (TPR) repeat protein
MGDRDISATGKGNFRAFVSYSHADAAIAQKLHRKLEGYRLPKKLRSAQDDIGKDGRLGPLFRDREDLPAASDLSASVKAALANSAALIVICSPHAKNSIWVNKEISLFREIHPDRPILAAIIDGEPEQAFPEALRLAGEPLAADLRKSADGWQLGLLKLVAGIANVPLDALVQRDAQRKVRSVMSVTLAVSIALLAMVGMTIYALQQRNEAQFQQAQAEGLVEYMLTDLREKLRGVGRLDVMTDVNQRLDTYCTKQNSLTERTTESLQLCIRLLHARGEDAEGLNNLALALRHFQQAHQLSKTLLERDPENPDFLFIDVQSKLYLALYHRNNGENVLANNLNHEARKLSKRLAAIRANEAYYRQAATIYSNLCAIATSSNTLTQQSQKDCETALAMMRKTASYQPEDFNYLSELANMQAWYGDFLVRQKKIQAGIKQLDAHLRIVDELMRKDPKNQQWKAQAARSYMGYAELFIRLDSPEKSIPHAKKATFLGKQLVKTDPDNTRWRTLLKRAENILR